MTDYLIIYHESCADGFGAALIAFDALRAPGTRLAFKRADPSDLDKVINSIPRDRYHHIYCFDVAFTAPQLSKLLELGCPDTLIYDHHLTTDSIKDPALRSHVTYDASESGISLAWRRFNGDRRTPALVEYIKQRDLYHLTDQRVRAICAFLHDTLKIASTRQHYDERLMLFPGDHTYPDFHEWLHYLKNEDWLRGAEEKGRLLLKLQGEYIKLQSRSAGMVEITAPNGKKLNMIVCNASLMVSDLAEYLYKNAVAMFTKAADLVAIWRIDQAPDSRAERCWVSLRSEEGKGADVEAIANMMGGGGHKHAAGFQTTPGRFMGWAHIT